MLKIDVLGVHIDVIDRTGIEDLINDCVHNRKKAVVAYANVHAVNIARRDGEFKHFLNQAAVLYCDGEGVRIGGRILGSRLPSRVALTRWIWDLCALCKERNYSVFFLGSTDEVLEKSISKLKARFPSLVIAGKHHGYFHKLGQESDAVVEIINKAKPNLVFVGFGMPIQEYWIKTNLEQLDAQVILPSGSMLEYIAGTRGVAPAWISRIGLEWLHRLIQEPRRLWKRYLIGNPGFLLHVLIQRLKRGKQV